MLSTTGEPGQSGVQSVVYGYLAERYPRIKTWDGATQLLQPGVIDSLGILELMTFLSDQYGISLEDEDFDPEHFATPGSLVQFILERAPAERLQQAG